MNKELKVLSTIAISILVLAGLFMVAELQKNNNAAPEKTGPSVLEAEHSSYDLGTISMKDGKVDHNFKIRNSSAESVGIEKIYTSCMCTEASLILDDREFGPFGMPGHGLSVPGLNQNLKPGQWAEIKVVYDPNAHGPAGVGPASRQIVIETKEGAPLVLTFNVNVTP